MCNILRLFLLIIGYFVLFKHFFSVFIVQQMKKLYTFAAFFRDKDDKSLCNG